MSRRQKRPVEPEEGEIQAVTGAYMGSPEADAEKAAREPSETVDDESTRNADFVRQLQPRERIFVDRTGPLWCKGYCETVTSPTGRLDDLLDVIRQSWGGGTYILKRFESSGHWARGQACVEIVGQPLERGVAIYANSYQRGQQNGAAPASPVVVNTPSQPEQPGVVGALASLVGSLAKPGSAAEQLQALVAMANGLRQAPAVDAVSQLDGLVGLLTKLQRANASPYDEYEPEGEGMPSDLGGVVGLLGRLMDKHQPTPPPQPQLQWDPHTQRWVMPPPPPPPPSPAGWSPYAPPVPPPHAHAPQYGPPPQPGPPPPQPPPANHPPAPAMQPQPGMPTEPQPVPEDHGGNGRDEDWYDGPITATEVADHVRGLTEAEAQKFLSDVMGQLGVSLPADEPPQETHDS